MSAVAITTEAVVLRATPYGEADLVVHLLGRGLGKVGAFARGARKSMKRFGGGIEPFGLLQVELQERRSAELLELRGATVLTPHVALRGDLARLAHAGYATELCRELLRDREPHDELLDSLLELFDTLARAGPRSITLRAFELSALGAAGLAPRLRACSRCGKSLEAGGVAGFDARLGGATCDRCLEPGMPGLDRATHRLLMALQEGGIARAAEATDDGLPLEAAYEALRAFIDRHVRHDLRSRAFMRDVGAPP